MATQNAWKVRKVREGVADIEQLLFHPDNPKIHPHGQTQAVTGAISELGWMAMIMVNLRTSEEWGDEQGVETVIDGHDRIKAAYQAGQIQVPVEYYDLSPNEEKLFLVTFDEITKMSGDDREAFKRLIDDLNTGEEALQKLLSDKANELGVLLDSYEDEPLSFDNEEPQIDRADELRQEWGTEAGQLWIMPARNGGEHRLLIGDCTDVANVERLMNGERAEMCFTSPPYSDQRTYEDGTNINVSYLKQFIPAFADHVNYFCINLGLVFRNHEPVEYWQEYIQAARDCGLKLLAWNVWNKKQAGHIGRQTMMFALQHEWVFVFGESAKPLNRTVEKSPNTNIRLKNYKRGDDGELIKTKRGADGKMTETTYGNSYNYKNLGTVLTHHAEQSREFTQLHPAIMRSEVAEEYIKAMTNEGEIVTEPFAGSGTTLIAAENLNRLCYHMELSAAYSAVVLQRYYDAFNIMPELASE